MIEYSFTTRTGKDKENEDCFRTVSADGVDVFVLTDGMGGRSLGAEAARLVAETMCVYPWNKKDVGRCIIESLCNADNSLKQRSEEMHFKMGCAVGCLVITDGEISYAGLGDVRLYIRGFAGDYKQLAKQLNCIMSNTINDMCLSIKKTLPLRYVLLPLPIESIHAHIL